MFRAEQPKAHNLFLPNLQQTLENLCQSQAKKDNQQQQQQLAQDGQQLELQPAAGQEQTAAATSEHQEDSPERASSPAGQSRHLTSGEQADQQPTRPGSASTKRRSKLLACFGAGQGSIDLLNSSADDASSSADGGDSPRQPCNEKLVQQRRILGDVVDSTGNLRDSPQASRHKRHLEQAQLVPDDYYIEQEPLLILNVEPKTYGKRLASSSAQTDMKLDNNGYLSTSAKRSGKKKSGLLRGRGRKNKTQLTIHCDAKPSNKTISSNQAPDSSLDTINGEALQSSLESQAENRADVNSIIEDVVTSDDLKWRTCTIQTDSDSVTVNYVTVAQDPVSVTSTGAGLDDGYVSGSGDLNRQSSAGKGLFGLSFGSSEKQQQTDAVKDEQLKKKKTKSEKRKQKADSKKAQKSKSQKVKSEEQNVSAAASPEPEVEKDATQLAADDSLQETLDESLAEQSTRSMSPTSKELKQKLKLEKLEKLKREKEEKRMQKELEDAAIKAERMRKKLEKETKKSEKLAAKLAGKKSATPASSSPTPPPTAEESSSANTAAGTNKVASVKFANTLVETNSISAASTDADNEPSEHHKQLAQLDSIQQLIETSNSQYEREKERLSQEDGNDLIRVSIGDSQADKTHLSSADEDESKLISFSDHSLAESESRPVEAPVEEDPVSLKPILKQQSTISSEPEVSAEITIGEPTSQPSTTLSEATDEAVKLADSLKESTSASSPVELSKKELAKQAKEEKQRLKEEQKAKIVEEKLKLKETQRLAKEAKEAKKVEEAQAKKAAKEAKLEQERLAKEAKLEQEKLAKEAKKQAKLNKKDEQSADSSKSEQVEVKIDISTPEEHTTDDKDEASQAVQSAPVSESIAESSSSSSKKAKKEKRDKKSEQENSESSSKSSGFFAKLFAKRSKDDAAASPVEDPKQETKVEEKPIIVSEMYPSNPDDADGELILEVNLPENLIDQKLLNSSDSQTNHSQKEPRVAPVDYSTTTSETPASPTLAATTIDESLATQAVQVGDLDEMQLKVSAEEQAQEQQQLDDQATLVNISQMICSDEDDEDATENIVSQTTNDLATESVQIDDLTTSNKRDSLADVAQVVESTSADTETKQVVVSDATDASKLVDESESAKTKTKKSKSELKEEKARKELEAKLQKEAKKQAKLDEKLRKKAEKEEELKVKMEKKMAALAEKKNLKEAKKAEKLAKKLEAQKSSPLPDTVIITDPVEGSSKPEEPTEVQKVEVVDDNELIDTSNMTPINTETEVQRIVEEVVGDDGVVTKTTKTIETKYVTMRQEELRVSERRDMSEEDYQRLKQLESEQVVDVGGSELHQEATIEKRPLEVKPYEHQELSEIKSTPSYFASTEHLNEIPAELSAKKAMKKRVKLNERLIKRAFKLAKKESSLAKKKAREAESEIAVCDEAAKEANKMLRKATKQAHKANKLAAKEHKKMDKIDKKIMKRQEKINKKQRKLDKKAAKLAKKEAKRLEKAQKQAKKLERKSSQKSSTGGSRKSIKLEDIGDPVLRSSSRLSIGQAQVVDESQIGPIEALAVSTSQEAATAGSDIQVELSVEDPQINEQLQSDTDEQNNLSAEQVQESQAAAASAAAAQLEDEEDEEIDVVNELPQIGSLQSSRRSQGELVLPQAEASSQKAEGESAD